MGVVEEAEVDYNWAIDVHLHTLVVELLSLQWVANKWVWVW